MRRAFETDVSRSGAVIESGIEIVRLLDEDSRMGLIVWVLGMIVSKD